MPGNHLYVRFLSHGSTFARRAVVVVVAFAIGVSNLRLYSPVDGPAEMASTETHLNFIRNELNGGLGPEMQQLFPEGYFFSYVLYGLARVEAGLGVPANTDGRATALTEARWALEQLDSPQGRAPFEASLKPSYGAFYVGWLNYLRAGIVHLQPEPEDSELRELEDACEEILVAVFGTGWATLPRNDVSPFLQSYPGQAWPVDMYPAMVSVQACAEYIDPAYRESIDVWLDEVDQLTDPAHGLVGHRVEPFEEHPRATSQTLILRFLAELDPARAEAAYQRYREEFVVTRLGLPAVQEHPSAIEAGGDVDSGPLFMRVSASATVVGISAAQVNGDARTAAAIRQTGEAFGVPLHLPGGRRYVGGVFPLGDLFVIWSSSAQLWFQPERPPIDAGPSWWWRLPTHGLSLAAGVSVWFWVWPGFRRRYRIIYSRVRRLAARQSG